MFSSTSKTMTTNYTKISKRQVQNVQFVDYIYRPFSNKTNMKDLLEQALDNEDIEMVIWLLQNDRRLMDHELSDGSTLKERLVQLNEYTYVLSKIK